MNRTNIPWATYTVNVVHGCSKPAAVPPAVLERIQAGDALGEALRCWYRDLPEWNHHWLKPGTSPECIRCYAEHLSNRRGWTPAAWTEANERENVQLHPERFREFSRIPVRPSSGWPSERERLFLCSMGDWAHRLVPDAFLGELWKAMLERDHLYLLLTKRADRAMEIGLPWPDNFWLGVTCGHPSTKWRIEYLRRSQARVRFISMEPLLASMLPLDLAGIQWVIVGGESGKGFRPMQMVWAREIRDECSRQGVAFFFKQDAAFNAGRRPYLVEADGSRWEWHQFPGERFQPRSVDPDIDPLPVVPA